ncbi:hypothetical protein CDAR_461341 [Caerostris darwini]|uniref:Uncharacterized protein n=1 Tax=Caerostris darwini TaxID=1538125 RepID=A0AAV4SBT6_9ARAC|nr:hypothetical protein CDAR_461341 [Caerostris darwini]
MRIATRIGLHTSRIGRGSHFLEVRKRKRTCDECPQPLLAGRRSLAGVLPAEMGEGVAEVRPPPRLNH